MNKFIHKINYYETDKMGITHHSNYIRFMEEARLDFLEKIGYPMTRIEADGITSPVVSIKCDYKRPSTFGNKLEIEVSITQYTGVKLTFSYIMKNIDTNETVAIASSVHCFLNPNGKPVPLKKYFQDLDDLLRRKIIN